VYVDAIPVGATPYHGALKDGFHRISVELDGRREQRDVTVEYAEPVSLEVALPQATGTIFVIGAPAGAQVRIDDRDAGTVPARLPLPAGPHALRVDSPGYAPYETPVPVPPGRELKVTARMTRASGGEASPGSSPGAAPDTGAGKRPLRAGYLFGFAGGA